MTAAVLHAQQFVLALVEFVVADRGIFKPIIDSASMLGSSWNIADKNGLAPIRSPAATKIVFLCPSRSWPTSVAICSAPPAGTVIFLVLSSGSAIVIPPGGGRR
jgi:hypothetical protein